MSMASAAGYQRSSNYREKSSRLISSMLSNIYQGVNTFSCALMSNSLMRFSRLKLSSSAEVSGIIMAFSNTVQTTTREDMLGHKPNRLAMEPLLNSVS